MKIDFARVLKNLDGSEAVDERGRPLTLGKVAAVALNAPGEDALHRGHLAMRVYGAGPDTDLTPEDAALIRDNLAATWAPIVVAQAHALLGG